MPIDDLTPEKMLAQAKEIDNFYANRELQELITKAGFEEACKLFQLGQKSMSGHNLPSPETRETFKNMTEELNKIKIDQIEIKSDVKVISAGMTSLSEKLDRHVEKEDSDREKQLERFDRFEAKIDETIKEVFAKAEEKFTAKWVEKMLIGGFKIAIVPIVGGIVFATWELVKFLARK